MSYTKSHMVYFETTSSDAKTPTKSYAHDVGWDLYTSKGITIPPRSFVDANTDIKIALPNDLWARITGRSSTWRGWTLLVMEGIIDTGYRGELFIGVYNPTQHQIEIPLGSRLAQLILHEHAGGITWMPREGLPPSIRSNKGFGSSGV